ncbi:MAG: thiol peroxidase [Spirochaetales bacterium]|nr:thiol peroxidase [Spirochaetales bacterium]
MAQITLKGNPIHTSGNLPGKGSKAPGFTLTTGSLEDVSLETYRGKKKILNIVPSLDTGVCAASAKTFDRRAHTLENTVILTISHDLPFAMQRFCQAEGVNNVVTLSAFRSGGFGRDYGVEIIDGPMKGLLSRAVVILDEENRVIYTEQVPEITQEPDYDAAVAAL